MDNSPFTPHWPPADPPVEDGLPDRYGCLMAVISWIIIALLLGIIFALTSCRSAKTVVQEHHHYSTIDTLAVQAVVDSRMDAWHTTQDSSYRLTLEDFRAEWSMQSEQREVTTETVTTATDSLGRTLRTEQRRTERTMSLQQQQLEHRLTQEYEARLATAIDSLDVAWQRRYSTLQSHIETQADTTDKITVTPQKKQIWAALILIFVAGVIGFLVSFLKK